jgi:hypothetical protein
MACQAIPRQNGMPAARGGDGFWRRLQRRPPGARFPLYAAHPVRLPPGDPGDAPGRSHCRQACHPRQGSKPMIGGGSAPNPVSIREVL